MSSDACRELDLLEPAWQTCYCFVSSKTRALVALNDVG
jgi:hypothetical protein